MRGILNAFTVIIYNSLVKYNSAGKNGLKRFKKKKITMHEIYIFDFIF